MFRFPYFFRWMLAFVFKVYHLVWKKLINNNNNSCKHLKTDWMIFQLCFLGVVSLCGQLAAFLSEFLQANREEVEVESIKNGTLEELYTQSYAAEKEKVSHWVW